MCCDCILSGFVDRNPPPPPRAGAGRHPKLGHLYLDDPCDAAGQ